MAYPIDPNDVIQLNIVGFIHGQEVMNTLHYKMSQTSPSVADGETLLNALFTDMDQAGGLLDLWAQTMPANLGGIFIELQKIYPLRYRKKVYTPTVTFGNRAASTTTNNAAVISLHGDAATRRSVGNKHLVTGPSDIDGGLLDPGYKGAVTDLMEQMLVEYTLGTSVIIPIIWGKPRSAYTQCGRDYPALPALRTTVVGGIVEETARVMRRRTVGLGV